MGYQLGVLAATACITASIHFNGDPTNNNVMLYLFVSIYAFYFFRLTEALAHALVIVIAYGWVMDSIRAERIEPTALVIATGVLLRQPQAAGFFSQAFSNASCGLPGGGGMSLVAESSGVEGLVFVPVPPLGGVGAVGSVPVASGTVWDSPSGTEIEIEGAVVSSSSDPQPVAAAPSTASTASSVNPPLVGLTNRRPGRAGAVRSRDSR